MYQDYNEFILNASRPELVIFITAYNDWIQNQLRRGALIFSPEDYYGGIYTEG